METLVKRIDSAHMERMYERTLESSDVAFLSQATDVTLEQVRRLKLGNEVEEKTPLKPQYRPPQPPKQSTQPTFFLNSFDFILDDGDAESWLVATPLEDKAHAKLKSAPLLDDKRETVVSPVDSTVSSEISRSSCLTPASVLEASLSRAAAENEGAGTLHGSRLRAGRRGDLGLLSDQTIDIRHLPRNNGSINHTPAPLPDAHLKPKPASSKIHESVTESNNMKPQKKPPKTTIGSKLRDRISGVGQKDSDKPKSSTLQTRPRSIGPIRRAKAPVVPTVPRPKSSLGNSRADIKPRRLSTKLKDSSSPPARRAKASAIRPASALGTVHEEKGDGKKMSRLRKMISPSPTPRPSSAFGRPRDESKAPRRSLVSRIASPAARPKSSLGNLGQEKITPRRTNGLSRIASPSLRPPRAGSRSIDDSKTKSTLLKPRKSSSSLPPMTQLSQGRKKEESKIKRKSVTNKNKLETSG